jgi:murein DD-endopeptidase MepM/ murein hydrolase activator NlpD
MKKGIIITSILIATLLSTNNVNAQEIDNYSFNDGITYLNDYLEENSLTSGYETMEDFIDYANNNYTIVDDINEADILVKNNQLYTLSHIDDTIYVTTVGKYGIYKDNKLNSKLFNDADMYVLPHKHLPLDSISHNSNFGYRTDPITGETKYHSGIDLAGNLGQNIYATEDGICSVSYDEEGYGNYVTIKHNDVYSTLYAHCSEILVSNGQAVKAGDIIARVGSTGRSTGPHLHFEYRQYGTPIDPVAYINQI